MKSKNEPENQSLNYEDGIKLLQEFRKGLVRRNMSFFKVSEASESCRSVTEMLRPYYEVFPDIQNKAEEVANNGGYDCLDNVFGEIGIYPESFEILADAMYN
jgi:hypothetical protein